MDALFANQNVVCNDAMMMILIRKFKDKDVTSLSSSRELIYTIVPYVVVRNIFT